MIVYSVICRSKDAAVLVEVSSPALTGNVPQVTTALLEHLRDHPAALKEGDLKTYIHRNEDDNQSYDFFSHFLEACTVAITSTDELDLGSVQEHYFHLFHDEGIFYCCLADDVDPKDQKVNFAFLQHIAKEFTAQYRPRRIKNANAYSLDKEFGKTVRSAMDYYNKNHKKFSRDEKVAALLAQVEDMKALLGRNISLLLEREAKLDRLVDKSEQMKKDTAVFKKRTAQLKKDRKWRNLKLCALLTGFVIVIIYTIVTAACGFTFQRCRAKE